MLVVCCSATLAGNLIFQGGREYGMMVYATEDYGDAAGASYWAVAVVRKSFCDARRNDVTLRDLKVSSSPAHAHTHTHTHTRAATATHTPHPVL